MDVQEPINAALCIDQIPKDEGSNQYDDHHHYYQYHSLYSFIPGHDIHPSISQVSAYVEDQILISGSINLFDTESYKRPAKSNRSPAIQCRGEYRWAHNKLLAINQGLCVASIYLLCTKTLSIYNPSLEASLVLQVVGQGSQEVHAAAPSIAQFKLMRSVSG